MKVFIGVENSVKESIAEVSGSGVVENIFDYGEGFFVFSI